MYLYIHLIKTHTYKQKNEVILPKPLYNYTYKRNEYIVQVDIGSTFCRKLTLIISMKCYLHILVV
jgi:hypothetical protein